jgi:hypothetical protein
MLRCQVAADKWDLAGLQLCSRHPYATPPRPRNQGASSGRYYSARQDANASESQMLNRGALSYRESLLPLALGTKPKGSYHGFSLSHPWGS